MIGILLALSVAPFVEFDREPAFAEYSGISRVPGTDRYWVVDDKGGVASELRISFGGGAAPSCSVLRSVDLAGRRDLEGCALDPLEPGVLWVSDERDSSVRAFSLSNGAEVARAPVPEIYGKCRKNRSLEALSISPDGLEMWTCNESTLKCDKAPPPEKAGACVRMQRFSRKGAKDPWKADVSFSYSTDPVAGEKFFGKGGTSGVSAVVALGGGRLIVLERECSVKNGGFLPSFRAMLYECSAHGAKRILWSADTGLANYEGACLGPGTEPGERTIVLVSDAGNGADGKIRILRLLEP